MDTTYTKLRSGAWGVRGPAAAIQPGARVPVTRRDGRVKMETVDRVIWTSNGIALASVRPSTRSLNGHGDNPHDRYCRVCGHDGDDCADLDCTCRACGGMLR